MNTCPACQRPVNPTDEVCPVCKIPLHHETSSGVARSSPGLGSLSVAVILLVVGLLVAMMCLGAGYFLVGFG